MLNVNNLIGFNSITKGRGEFVASTSSTGATVVVPSSTLAGDLIVLHQRAVQVSSPAPTAVTPSGFTNAVNVTDTQRRFIMSYKVAELSDIGRTLTGMDGSAEDAKIVTVFRGPFSNAQHFSAGGQLTDGDPAARTITSETGNTVLIILAFYKSTSNGSGQTFTPTQDGKTSAVNDCFAAYKTYIDNPQNVTIDCTDGGNGNTLAGCYIQCI